MDVIEPNILANKLYNVSFAPVKQNAAPYQKTRQVCRKNNHKIRSKELDLFL